MRYSNINFGIKCKNNQIIHKQMNEFKWKLNSGYLTNMLGRLNFYRSNFVHVNSLHYSIKYRLIFYIYQNNIIGSEWKCHNLLIFHHTQYTFDILMHFPYLCSSSSLSHGPLLLFLNASDDAILLIISGYQLCLLL